MIVFSFLILGWSAWAIYSAVALFRQGNMESFYFYMAASMIALALAASSLLQMKKRLTILYHVAAKILTTIQCISCGRKVERKFGSGDYVHKQAGTCQQCNSAMVIQSIYSENAKKR